MRDFFFDSRKWDWTSKYFIIGFNVSCGLCCVVMCVIDRFGCVIGYFSLWAPILLFGNGMVIVIVACFQVKQHSETKQHKKK